MEYDQENIVQMQLKKYDLFKEQNLETGRFDVIFELKGKILYAHKTMLILESDTFDSMLSERWTPNKDQPIKIETYSYDDFFQFLTFLYSGKCELTDSNIFSMIDIAEFYGVQLFKAYCDKYLAAMEFTTENIFQLMELAEKYAMVQLKASVYGYITKNFKIFAGSDGFLGAKKSVIQEIFTAVKDNVKPEELLQSVYKWCEKQSMNVQTAHPNLNLNDAIKAEMSDFLPQFCFDKMELKFLLQFLIPRAFIFSSLDELSELLCDRIVPKVKITNGRGQTLHGELKCDKVFIEAIKALKSSGNYDQRYGINMWECKNIVLNQSSLKKRDGIEWYLIYFSVEQNQYIGFTRRSVYFPNEYLLAELTAEPSDFILTLGSKIEIE